MDRSTRWRMAALAALVVSLTAVVPLPPPVLAAEPWLPPVDAPVADPFRPPENRWSPGNRGLAYTGTEGQAVVAVDDGVVTFAARVAGALHVVVDHGDGLRSTYAYLAGTSVVRGQRVARGEQLATASANFHLGARLGDRYVDPALLLAGVEPVPRLVPAASPDAARGGRGGGGLLGRLAGAVAGVGAPAVATAGWIGAPLTVVVGEVAREHLGAAWSAGWSALDPLRALGQQARELLPSAQALQLVTAITAWRRSPNDCTPDDVAVPPPAAGRVLVQVGGLGTTDRGASIGRLDPAAVGYRPGDVVGFSYAGGCTPAPFGDVGVAEGSLTSQLDARPYTAADTYQDLEVSAARLADLIERVRVERPGAPIDVAAHSLGGVVTARALELLAERGSGVTPVSVVVAAGSPYQGAELAGAAVALGLVPTLELGLAVMAPEVAGHAGAASVRQLARGTSTRLPAPRAPPDGVRVVSVGAPGDLVVPASNTRWDGATNTIAGPIDDVGLDVHGALPGRPEVARELALAVAGLPARCVSLAAAIGGSLVSRAVALAETGVAFATVVALQPL